MRYVYMLSQCGPRRTQAESVTHVLYLCELDGDAMRTLPVRDSLAIAMANEGVAHRVHVYDGVRYLYVNAPGDRTRRIPRQDGVHAYFSGGRLRAATLDEAEAEAACAIRDLA
jgi:DNA-binding cell septation regulator SpoVG